VSRRVSARASAARDQAVEIEIEKREVQQPFAGIVDDVEMHRPRPRDRAEKPRGPDPERQAQFRHRAGAVGPVRVGPRHGREVILEGEAGHGVVGLGLQEGGLDPARARGLQPRHAAPVEEVGDERGDEDGLARPREAGDAEADDRFEEGLGNARGDPLHAAPERVRYRSDHQGWDVLLPARIIRIGIARRR
jgi:hypothetical protein